MKDEFAAPVGEVGRNSRAAYRVHPPAGLLHGPSGEFADLRRLSDGQALPYVDHVKLVGIIEASQQVVQDDDAAAG